jgi:hypothetical protein
LRHDKKPRRSGAKSAMWAAEKGGGNAAHTETLPQKRLPAQAGNVIQLRCKPTARHPESAKSSCSLRAHKVVRQYPAVGGVARLPHPKAGR